MDGVKSEPLFQNKWLIKEFGRSKKCLFLSLFFEHYNRILLCEWVIELYSIRFTDGVSCHNAFAFYLDSTNLGIGALLRSSVATSVTG